MASRFARSASCVFRPSARACACAARTDKRSWSPRESAARIRTTIRTDQAVDRAAVDQAVGQAEHGVGVDRAGGAAVGLRRLLAAALPVPVVAQAARIPRRDPPA